MVLVERDRQLTQLSDLLENCVHGAGSVAIVRGPVAVGKTKLMHTFSERVTSTRARFLGAAGSPAERHLPFGLLSQLFHAPGAVKAHREQVMTAIESSGRAPGEVGPRVLEDVSRAFLDMAAAEPLLIGVDDVYHADAESLQCLLFIARRVRRARIMLVLNDQDRSGSGHSHIRTELSRQPYYQQIRLDPLSSDGVAALLAHELDAHVAHSLAAGAFAATGGNPLLVQALAEDWQASARSADFMRPSGLVVGDYFAERVVSCLYRCESDVLAVARAIAVFGEASQPALVAGLTDVDVIGVRVIIGLLNDSGILQQGHYRHPVAQAAVLRDLSAEQRAELHRRAARMIHAEGGQPTSIAHHLIAAGETDEPWASAVLQESADSATASGQLDFALDCLKLAHNMADGEQQRAVGRAVLAEAEWKVDPGRVVRHLGQLTGAIHEGWLTGNHALSAIEYLLWHGRVDAASLALDRLSDRTAEPGTATGLREVRACLELCYPAQRLRVRTDPVGPEFADSPDARRATPSLVTAMLTAARGWFAGEGEYLWQGFRLGEPALAPISVALLALARPERLTTLAPWCLPLLDDAAAHGGPIWQGLLAAVRADTALLQGDLPGAAELASTALTEIPRQSWGVVVGAPLACLLTSAVEMGRYEDATACLATPVPGALLETPFGLRYLRARGQYQLAINRPYAALSDFQTCGQLVRTWEIDGPGAMPWRIDAAQALLRLGRGPEAHKLLDEQLGRLRDGDERARGRALRHLAAAREPRERPLLLTDAVEVLQAAGDHLELAHTLADLGGAYNLSGDSRRARLTLRRAWRVAKECQAEGLSKTLLPSLAGTPSMRPGSSLPDGDGAAELSAAEYRVGTLAAQGFTNRQIADKLCITVSTVEQHLTQVYRKLKVKSRIDLPVYLQINDAEGPAQHPPFRPGRRPVYR